jgi:hypothetical protein
MNPLETLGAIFIGIIIFTAISTVSINVYRKQFAECNCEDEQCSGD